MCLVSQVNEGESNEFGQMFLAYQMRRGLKIGLWFWQYEGYLITIMRAVSVGYWSDWCCSEGGRRELGDYKCKSLFQGVLLARRREMK